MNKKLFSLMLLLVGALTMLTFTACSSDDDNKDEPQQITTATRSDLTTPWMLIPESQANDESFSFLAFEDNRAAIGTFHNDGTVTDVIITNSWSYSNGILKVNNRELGKVTKVTQKGVTVLFINQDMYVPSNVRVNGNKSVEDVFMEGGITRADFWKILEQANGK